MRVFSILILGLLTLPELLALPGLLTLAALPRLAWATPLAWGDLTPAEQSRVQNGEQVTHTASGTGASWPQIWVYQRVEATPEEAMAVYSDFDRQAEYLPDFLASRISRRLDRATVEVNFTLATHFFLHPRENYTTRDVVSVEAELAGYRVDWKLVSAETIRGMVGSARFEPLGTGTLVCYYTFITPPSLGNGEAGRMVELVQRSVSGFAGRLGSLRAGDRALLGVEIEALREAVGR